jgi:hypothetical protein
MAMTSYYDVTPGYGWGEGAITRFGLPEIDGLGIVDRFDCGMA